MRANPRHPSRGIALLRSLLALRRRWIEDLHGQRHRPLEDADQPLPDVPAGRDAWPSGRRSVPVTFTATARKSRPRTVRTTGTAWTTLSSVDRGCERTIRSRDWSRTPTVPVAAIVIDGAFSARLPDRDVALRQLSVERDGVVGHRVAHAGLGLSGEDVRRVDDTEDPRQQGGLPDPALRGLERQRAPDGARKLGDRPLSRDLARSPRSFRSSATFSSPRQVSGTLMSGPAASARASTAIAPPGRKRASPVVEMPQTSAFRTAAVTASVLEPDVGENRLPDEVPVREGVERDANVTADRERRGRGRLRGCPDRLRSGHRHRGGRLLLRVLEPAEDLLDARPREVAGGDVHVEGDRLVPERRAARDREPLFVEDERGRRHVDPVLRRARVEALDRDEPGRRRNVEVRRRQRALRRQPAEVLRAGRAPGRRPRFRRGAAAVPRRASRSSPRRNAPRIGRR